MNRTYLQSKQQKKLSIPKRCTFLTNNKWQQKKNLLLLFSIIQCFMCFVVVLKSIKSEDNLYFYLFANIKKNMHAHCKRYLIINLRMIHTQHKMKKKSWCTCIVSNLFCYSWWEIVLDVQNAIGRLIELFSLNLLQFINNLYYQALVKIFSIQYIYTNAKRKNVDNSNE